MAWNTNSFDFIIFTDLQEILLNCTATVDDVCFKLVNPSHLVFFLKQVSCLPRTKSRDKSEVAEEKT